MAKFELPADDFSLDDVSNAELVGPDKLLDLYAATAATLITYGGKTKHELSTESLRTDSSNPCYGLRRIDAAVLRSVAPVATEYLRITADLAMYFHDERCIFPYQESDSVTRAPKNEFFISRVSAKGNAVTGSILTLIDVRGLTGHTQPVECTRDSGDEDDDGVLLAAYLNQSEQGDPEELIQGIDTTLTLGEYRSLTQIVNRLGAITMRMAS